MATLIVSPGVSAHRAFTKISRQREERRFAPFLITLLTFFALAVHGYHPYAEDGGPYITGIKHILNPSLYPHEIEFVAGHPRFSFFATAIAALVKASHLSLEQVLLTVQFFSYWTMLFAAWHLAAACYQSRRARTGAVSLLAVWLTLPVAGTSILLMDPYVTARSISTPCALLAIAGIAAFFRQHQRSGSYSWPSLALCCTALLIATAAHPLMAAYAFGTVLILACQLSESRRVRRWGTCGLILLALVIAALIQRSGPPEPQTYLQAEMSRSYWFLENWAWYERIGLAAPLVILGIAAFKRRGLSDGTYGSREKRALARMSILCVLTAVAVLLFFGRSDAASHRVAWLQPLRILQIAYVLMTLGLGAELGQRFLKRSWLRWSTVFAVLAGIMITAERQTFGDTAHFELPGCAPRNSWEQAFLWIKENTPQEALFALDADYIVKSTEDAQNFRALSERSSLPDYTKDGGDAANNLRLAYAWVSAQAPQTRLSMKSDAERIAELRPMGVSWVVLESSARTSFRCDYANAAVKVCRLPPRSTVIEAEAKMASVLPRP